MIDFPYHTIDSAPADAKPVLQAGEKVFGMVPNLFRKMAEAPALLEGYWELSRIFGKTSLNPIEQQVVLLSVSVGNRCNYCVGAHSALADTIEMPTELTDALRAGQSLPDPRLDALRRFTQIVVETAGWVPDDEVQSFLDAGYSRAQILEVVLGVGLKTLSNYTNHLAGTELDPAFGARAWQPEN